MAHLCIYIYISRSYRCGLFHCRSSQTFIRQPPEIYSVISSAQTKEEIFWFWIVITGTFCTDLWGRTWNRKLVPCSGWSIFVLLLYTHITSSIFGVPKQKYLLVFSLISNLLKIDSIAIWWKLSRETFLLLLFQSNKLFSSLFLFTVLFKCKH